MTKEKDFKRLVRARMERTDESYTTARAVLKKRLGRKEPIDLATAAAIRDETVRKATGLGWAEWVAALDEIEAIDLPHREIAQHVKQNYPDVSFWWAQSVTIGYERIRGLRDVGQQRSGTYDVNKSKTFAVPVSELYAAFADLETRERWLPGAVPEARTSRESRSRSIRWTWADGSPVDCYFTEKSESKSTVQIQHRKHPSKDQADERRAYWTERLTELAEIFA